MDTKDIPKVAPTNWVPEKDELTLAALGKLGEECNELGAALFRSVIQGFMEPHTNGDGKLNRDVVMDEIADVEAMISCVKYYMDMREDEAKINNRRMLKIDYKRPWFNWILGRSAARMPDVVPRRRK